MAEVVEALAMVSSSSLEIVLSRHSELGPESEPSHNETIYQFGDYVQGVGHFKKIGHISEEKLAMVKNIGPYSAVFVQM
jgi:hypothetical protein